MSTATLKPISQTSTTRPRLLVVDDEPEILSILRDAIAARVDCKLTTATDLREARKIIDTEQVDVLLTDLHLPDGDGMSLVSDLRLKQPAARTVVITGQASVDSAVGALREGVIDYVSKPFSMDQIVERVNRAVERQTMIARNEKRLGRLKDAVRRLNQSRKVVSKKVDLLCNDLITAYGDVAKQVEDVRNQESFRRLLETSKDLEQMLCHAMDWILRNAGYCNLAVWLAADDADFQLGAYMKYTIPGEPALTEALKQNLVPMAARDGVVHLSGYDVKKHLTESEFKFLKGNTVLATNCTYLGESLAVLVLFRDEKCPFVDDDLTMLKAIAPVFATALAGMVRKHEGNDEYGDGGGSGHSDNTDSSSTGGTAFDDEKEERRRREEKKKKEQYDADWWKRGDPPPF